MIVCGWCGKDTANRDRCTTCGHADPERPWVQRGEPVPEVAHGAGRPVITDADLRQRLASGGTDDDIAARFEVDPRTVRRWRAKVSG